MKAVLSARSLKSSAPVDVIHYHLQPSDRQLNGYSSTGFFVRGLVILWTACLLKREYCPYLSVPLRELGQRRHTDIVQFALFFFLFFFKWRGKVFIFKLRFFFVLGLHQYALCYQVTIFFSSFLFIQYPRQMLTHLTML